MKIVDEISLYCKQENPTGAIMLTGKWGTGKTYFIEQELKEKVSEKNVIMRISLFGLDSIDRIHKAIKESWLETYAKEKGVEKAYDHLKNGKQLVEKISPSGVLGAFANIDISDVLSIKNEINEKRVVLVFDDLERSKLDYVDVLGCINEYCENKKFPTIIVSNESKMLDPQTEEDKDILKYSEIKEKIIYKTIQYNPDYKEIVMNIIGSMPSDYEKYKIFLTEHIQNLTNMLEHRGNVRSMKCALHDFYRIHSILCEYNMEFPERYLMAYVALVLYWKEQGGKKKLIIAELQDQYGRWFDAKYLFDVERIWVMGAAWDEEMLRNEIKSRTQPTTAKDIFKKRELLDIDEKDMEEGFSEVLEEAYKGELSLNEYMQFISNMCKMRKYGIDLYENVNWEQVRNGIETYARFKCNDEIYKIQELDDFNETEGEVYSTVIEIVNFHIPFGKSKEKYYHCIKENTYSSWSQLKRESCCFFDEEMAKYTVDCFLKCTNSDKNKFIDEFNGFWENSIRQGMNKSLEVIQSYRLLIELLEQAKKEADTNKYRIQCVIIEQFIKKVQELIRMLEEYK